MDKAAWVSPQEELKNIVLVFLLIIEFYRLFKKPRHNFVDIIVLEDTTCQRTPLLTANDIIDRYRYEEDLEQRATFRYSTLSESCKTEAIETTTGRWQDNLARNTKNGIDLRFKEIESFHERVTNIIGRQHETNEQPVLLPQSGIFKAVVDEFNVFAVATEKTLLISSGLFERSSLFDIQSPTDVALLNANPKAIARRYTKAYKINKAKAVTMVLLYDPRDKADWERFLKMADIISLVFTPKGARVSIKTNSKIHAL